MTEKDVNLKIESGDWISKQVNDSLLAYKNAKTHREKVRLIPRLKSLQNRLLYSLKELDDMIKENNEKF